MASRADIMAKLGLDSSGFKNGLKKAKYHTKSFVSDGVKQFARMGAAFAGIGLVKGILNLGTAAAETASKFEAVFGPATDEMNQRIVELKENIPATTAEMQNALSTFAAMGNAFGLNSSAANEFSVNMTKIAGDLASFHNLRPEEAFKKIQSAISGEFEPMKQLGIVINEATLKQEALNLAIWDGTGQMSAAQKALTVQSLLIKQMGVAQGDAAATANSAANQIKFLQSKLKDTGAEIGTTILPAVVSLVGAFSKLINGAKGASEAVGSFLAVSGSDTHLGKMTVHREQAGKNLIASGKMDEMNAQQRMKWILEEEKRLDKAFDDRVKARNEETKAVSAQEDIESGITNEITDPKRKKASEDYLASLKAQIAAAGELSSVQAAKPISRAAQESREVAKDAVELAKAATQPKGIQTGSIRGAGKVGSGPSAAFLQKERDLGMYNTTLGRNLPKAFPAPSGMKAKAQEEKADSKNLESMREDMSAIRQEMTRT